MKSLFVIRHAKSAYGPQYDTDFERPLNKRGHRDAIRMAEELKRTCERLDYMLVSSAQRTKETAAHFIEAYEPDAPQVSYTKTLYLPDEEDIWSEVRSAPDDSNDIAVVTHNPATEDLLQRFRPGTRAPTCSIIELHYNGDRWNDIDPSKVRFVSHKYPKLYV